MKAIWILSSIFLILNGSFAFSKETHREHAAHVHGAAKLAIAFDQLSGQIEFRAAAQSVLGFEYLAKTPADLKTTSQAKNRFQNEIGKMIEFDGQLNCRITPKNIEQVMEGKHSDFVANFQVVCEKSPLGSVLKINFTAFPNMKDLDITVLIDLLQKTAEARGQALEIELK